jgi:acetyl esterase/lipase
MKRRGAIGLAVAVLAAVLLLVTARRGQPGITVHRDLAYGEGGDRKLQLDLAMPTAGAGPFPAVVFLHGKGWRAGNRQEMNHFIAGVARMGYVGVTVEYRLVPTARFPAQVEDCKAAVRWLRANAQKYRLHPDHIGVVGFSAGGHLACMLGVTDKDSGLEGTGGNPDQSSRVQAVVSFFGPTDFTTRDLPKDLEKEVVIPFLGGSFAEKPEVYQKASPVRYVTKNAPPFLFVHGTDDKLVALDQSKRLAEKLKGVGVSARVVVLEGEGHGFSDAANRQAMTEMMDFLGERLKP